MAFNFFDLHNSEEDVNNRRLLRVYSVVPKFSKIKTGSKAEQAIIVTAFLRRVNEKLKKEIGPFWKNKWVASIGFKFAKKSVGDWFIGRGSIPLIALEKLEFFGLKKEVGELMQKVNYISSTTQDIVRIPRQFNSDMLYLCGVILGDGTLSINHRRAEKNRCYKVLIHSKDKENLRECNVIISKEFQTETMPIKLHQSKSGSCWFLQKGGKAIYRFFTQIVGIPDGDKSGKACVPISIKKLPVKQVVPFLAGLVDSDIGKHGKGMGCTFKSKKLVKDLIVLFAKLNITAKYYGSHYKNNKYIQHDFSIPKSQINKFKDVLVENYLPKRKDRLNIICALSAGIP